MERILVIGLSNDHGGIENYIINLYRTIDHSILQFDFLVKEELNPYYKQLIDELGGNIYVVGTLKRNIPDVWKKLCEIYRNRRYQKIYVNMSYSLALLYILPSLKKGLHTLFLHSHASDDIRKIRHKVFRFLFYKIILKNTKCIFMGCSEQSCVWQFGKQIARSERMYIIKNAVDYCRFSFSNERRDNIRRELGISEKNTVIGHVGRFSKEKNHVFIIDMFEKYVIRNPEARLLLVGDGLLYNDIMDSVNDRGLNDKVIFIGSVDDTSVYYNAMDCFILPSLYEGFPIVAVEAQINGLYCVVSRNITSQIDLFRRVRFADIENIDEWVDTVSAQMRKDTIRSISRDDVRCAGFDLDEQNKVVQDILLL